MMVAVTLMLIIIAALLSVFYQTQRAFRLSVTQVDVLETGRAQMEAFVSELPEIAPSNQSGQTNLYAVTMFPFLIQPRLTIANAAPRTNVIQDFFFLRKHNDEWIGTGYYDDDYAKVGDQWKFASRRFTSIRLPEMAAQSKSKS